jgi:hypothetical protein
MGTIDAPSPEAGMCVLDGCRKEQMRMKKRSAGGVIGFGQLVYERLP